MTRQDKTRQRKDKLTLVTDATSALDGDIILYQTHTRNSTHTKILEHDQTKQPKPSQAKPSQPSRRHLCPASLFPVFCLCVVFPHQLCACAPGMDTDNNTITDNTKRRSIDEEEEERREMDPELDHNMADDITKTSERMPT